MVKPKNAYRPGSIEEACRLRADTGAVPLAGGTDLMVRHRRSAGLVPDPGGPVLFIGHIKSLRRVEESPDAVRIGACATYTSLLEHEAVPEILKRCIALLASPPIRNRGTVGGNICNSSPAGDTLPVLYALDSSLVLASIRGERLLPIDRFITGPGKNTLADDEILKEIVIPKAPFSMWYYRKVGTRRSNALSKISFAGLLSKESSRVRDIRIALGAVAPTVVRSREIEAELKGMPLETLQHTAGAIAARYRPFIRPITDQRSTQRYRAGVSMGLIEQFLTTGLEQKG
jgi:xanthine dehydrogenase FAD-binding subunit